MISAAAAVPTMAKCLHIKSVIENGEECQSCGSSAPHLTTAHTETEMLAISIEKQRAKRPSKGYHIAGKTGTAEIPGPGD
jgi:hypothetical protein